MVSLLSNCKPDRRLARWSSPPPPVWARHARPIGKLPVAKRRGASHSARICKKKLRARRWIRREPLRSCSALRQARELRRVGHGREQLRSRARIHYEGAAALARPSVAPASGSAVARRGRATRVDRRTSGFTSGGARRRGRRRDYVNARSSMRGAVGGRREAAAARSERAGRRRVATASGGARGRGAKCCALLNVYGRRPGRVRAPLVRFRVLRGVGLGGGRGRNGRGAPLAVRVGGERLGGIDDIVDGPARSIFWASQDILREVADSQRLGPRATPRLHLGSRVG